MPSKVSFLLNSQNQMKQLCSLVARLRDVTFSVGCKIARCDVVLPLTERSLVIERFSLAQLVQESDPHVFRLLRGNM